MTTDLQQLYIQQWCAELEQAVDAGDHLSSDACLNHLKCLDSNRNPLQIAISRTRWDWVRDILCIIWSSHQVTQLDIAMLLMRLSCPLEPVITSYGYEEVVKQMLRLGANVRAPSCVCACTTPLHQAVWAAINYERDGELVTCVLLAGAEVDALDESKSTALHLAPRSKYYGFQIVNILLRFEATVNLVDANGCTPLFYALHDNPDERVVYTLLSKGAMLRCDKVCCVAPNVHFAKHREVRQGLIHLLSCEIDVNERDAYGNTYLHYAASLGHYKMTQLLLERGADPNSANPVGVTPLHLIIQHYKNPAMVFKDLKSTQRMLQLCFEYAGDVLQCGINGRSLLDETRACDQELAKTIIEEIARRVKEVDMVRSLGQQDHVSLTYATYWKLIRSDAKLKQHFEDCQRELMRMRNDVFFADVTMFQLLEASIDKMLEYLADRKFYKTLVHWLKCMQGVEKECTRKVCCCRKYPIYRDYVISRSSYAVNCLNQRKSVAEMLVTLLDCFPMYDLFLAHIVPRLTHSNCQRIIKGVYF